MHKGYKCLNSFGKIYISASVKFDENNFPLKTYSSFLKQKSSTFTNLSFQHSLHPNSQFSIEHIQSG